MYQSISSTSPKFSASHVTVHSASMQILHKDLFWLSFFIFIMLFKMQGCGTCSLYEEEGLEGGFALSISSKQ